MDEKKRFTILRETLDFHKAMEWLRHDAADDHFQDPIRYSDLAEHAEKYLERTKHKRFNHFELSAPVFQAPKPRYFLRDIIHLPPVHRLLYLALLAHLLPKVDPKLPQEVYSYRLDSSEDESSYPFRHRAERWKDFMNDFRRSALQDGAQAVLITDIASYYDHISTQRLDEVLRAVLGGSIGEDDDACLSLLKELLDSWTQDGFGMPINYDPSSFFSSVYLTPVDRQMVASRFTYLRWADDIRVVASSQAQAIRALHQLQSSLRTLGLFLSTAKTRIIEKGTDAFDEIMDVADEVKLSEISGAISSGDRSSIEPKVDVALERARFHAGPTGDDRKFRAFSNQLTKASKFPGLRARIWPAIKELVLPRLHTHPERSDWWVKLLSQDVDAGIQERVHHCLTTPGQNIFDWQRMYLWELLIRARGDIKVELLEHAKAVSVSLNCDAVAARATILRGQRGDGIDRDALFAELYQRNRSDLIKRAVLIAIQEMEPGRRDRLYAAALKMDPNQSELVDWLRERDAPVYTLYQWQEREFATEARKRTEISRRGIGTIDRQVVRFTLTRLDYDYE